MAEARVVGQVTGGRTSGQWAALMAARPRLLRFARTLTRNADDAEDLVQATCVRAIERYGQYRPGTNLVAWLFSIARSIHLNRVRSTETRRAYATRMAEEEPAPRHPWPQLEARASLAVVSRCFETLPEEQRSVLYLVVVEGFSYREAADVLDIPIGTLTSRLSRARFALRDAVEGTERGADDCPIGRERHAQR